MALRRLILFCDIDGTLVHYPDDAGAVVGTGPQNGTFTYRTPQAEDATVLLLPPSTTGLQGIISLRTLTLLQQWRSLGNLLVIADAVISENGGRLWLADATLPTAAGLREDLTWRQQHAALVGPPGVEAVPPEQRPQPLWRLYHQLLADGWRLDATHYSTAFRIKLAPPKTAADLQLIRASLASQSLTSSFNLGSCDVYPASTGKEGAANYLMHKWGVRAADCVLLCDDDNDLGLAAVVGRVFCPSIATDSMAAAVAADTGKFTASQSPSVWGAEEAVSGALAHAAQLQPVS